MVYATLEQMRVRRPGGIDAADHDRAEALLADASVLIDDEVGPVKAAEWAAPGATIPPAIGLVCLQVALRVFENPGGLSMEQATGYMYQRPVSGVTGMELSKPEKARVRAAAGKATAFSIRIPTGVDEETMGTVFATEGGE